MIIDTHSHIYATEFDSDLDVVIREAKELGVEKHILANVDHTTIDTILNVHNRYKNCTYVAMGMHPTSVDDKYNENLNLVGEALFEKKCDYVAVGEIGIDLYWDTTFKNEQIKAFETQIDWALQLDLPLMLHTRKAHAEVFDVLKKFNKSYLHGVFHCFSGGVEEAKKAIAMGFYLGIGGVVTYKNSNLGDIISTIPLENILLETDAPYLPPVPYRGKRNEPKYLVEINEKIASVFNCSASKVEEITTRNAIGLFNL